MEFILIDLYRIIIFLSNNLIFFQTYLLLFFNQHYLVSYGALEFPRIERGIDLSHIQKFWYIGLPSP
jgi:hypothetical protein